MIRAIIFDFDGVLVETEPLHYEAFRRVLPAFGIRLSRDSYFNRYVGLADREILRRLQDDFGRTLTSDEAECLLKKKGNEYRRQFVEGIQPLPGVVEFIKQVPAQWPLAVCSGSRKAEIKTILGQIGLLEFFKEITASEDVTASKPDPAGYLLTLEKLQQSHPGLTERECLVFEDSEAGIAAAKAAGMSVIAILKNEGSADTTRADGAIVDFRGLTIGDLESRVS